MASDTRLKHIITQFDKDLVGRYNIDTTFLITRMSIEKSKSYELPFGMPELKPETFVAEKKWFAEYLLSRPNWVQEIDRDTPLGKYLRTMRFYNTLDRVSQDKQSPVHVQWLIALVMQESKWDPLSRNLKNWWWSDGGAWLLHTQPDTGKRNLWLSLYSDQEWMFKKPVKVWSYVARSYKDCDYDYLTKTKKFSHVDAYKIHGAWLVQLKEDMNRSYAKLSQLDDRFNDAKNITATIQYFTKAKDSIQARANHFHKDISPSQIEMYILNSFNKWYGRQYYSSKQKTMIYQISPRFGDHWSHMSNLKANFQNYEKYNKILEQWLRQWLSYPQLYAKIVWPEITTKSSTKPKVQQWDSSDVTTVEQQITTIKHWEQKTTQLSQLLVDQITKAKENTNYIMTLTPSSNTNAVHFEMTPLHDTSKKYSLVFDTKWPNWVIRDSTGLELQFSSKISVWPDTLFRMICSVFNNTFASKPDDVDDGVCKYVGQQIMFNRNRNISDIVVADKDLLQPIFKAFPTKWDDVCQKLVTMINNVYKNPWKIS